MALVREEYATKRLIKRIGNEDYPARTGTWFYFPIALCMQNAEYEYGVDHHAKKR